MSDKTSSHRDILLVDDDVEFCNIMGEILRGRGLRVHVAFDVPQALQMLKDIKVDLILTDLMMPEVDGLTLIRRIRSDEEWTKIPTVVVSARAMPDEIEAARGAGADAFVKKPFSIRELHRTLDAFLHNGDSLHWNTAHC